MRDHGPKVFQIETTMNTDMFPSPFDFLSKREWEWNAKDRATFLGHHEVAQPHTQPRWRARSSIASRRPHQMTSVQAGDAEAVHKITHRATC